jgi:tetratricopeptide (TPR) repeat protein
MGYSYMNLGVIRANLDDWAGARDLFGLCLEQMEQSGEPRDLARALNNFANALDVLNEKERARQLHERALEIREREHDLHGVCYSLSNLGALEFDLEHYAEARAFAERALRLARQVVDPLAVASNLAQLGAICLKQRDYDAARGFFQQALDVRRQVDDRSGIIVSTRELGDVARETGDTFAAQDYYREALALGIDAHFEAQALNTIRAIARLLIGQRRLRPALKLLAFVRGQRETPNHQDEALINELEADMPPHGFASAVALGEALTLEAIRAKIEAGDWDF